MVLRIIRIIVLALFLNACKNTPRIIQPITEEVSYDQSTSSTGIFKKPAEDQKMKVDQPSLIHSVVIKEVLPTSKYIYLRVNEGGRDYWIATLKKDVEVGGQYFFKEGILKTNFESKEHDRLFDTMYLVSQIIPSSHGNQHGTAGGLWPSVQKDVEKDHEVDPAVHSKEGSRTIEEILNSPAAFVGKHIQVSGVCVKVNYNIMGRNWLHLKDGSMDEYDFVATSAQIVSEGQVITLEGIFNEQRDFGAGYYYDFILEDAKVVQ